MLTALLSAVLAGSIDSCLRRPAADPVQCFAAWNLSSLLSGSPSGILGIVAAARGSQYPARSIRCAPVLGMTTSRFTGCLALSQSLRGETKNKEHIMRAKLTGRESSKGGERITMAPKKRSHIAYQAREGLGRQ